MVVTALGRMNLGIAAKFMQDEFKFTTDTMGWILGAFAFGYALFQIPCGWAGDRFGPRATLTVALLGWGICTVLVGVLPSLSWLSLGSLSCGFGLFRLCTGAGEAASYPNANKIVAWWTPPRERGLGSSFLLGGVGAGGVIAPLLFASIIQRLGWRWSFVFTGALAAIVAFIWFLCSTNRPEEHPRVNAAELDTLESSQRPAGQHSFGLAGTPWPQPLSIGAAWALVVSYFCHRASPYIYSTRFFI